MGSKVLRPVVSVVIIASLYVVLQAAASYPTSVKTFTSRVDGDTISASHINDLQDEVSAIETDLLKAWTTVSHSAGDFTGAASMTWTVASGDVITYAYHKIGKRMTVSWEITNSTVGGTAASALQIAIPGGFTATRNMNSTHAYEDDGTINVGLASVAASGTVISLYKNQYSSTWDNTSTDNTNTYGSITFQVN